MAYQYIEVEEHGKVLVLRLADPATRNALGQEMQDELLAEMARFEESPDLRCLVLTGTDPAFSSGGNVRGMQVRREAAKQLPPRAPLPWASMDAQLSKRATEPRGAEHRSIHLVLGRIQKPTIAAVNGYALGVGNALALNCDIRIASEKAAFAETFIQRGLVSGGACWQLPRMIGLSNTFLMVYTGDRIDAETALRWGLVSKVVPHEKLMEETLKLATRLAEGATFALGLVKYLVQKSAHLTYEEALRLSGTANNIARMTEDHQEGVRAFLEKRAPRFQGR